MKVRLRTSRFGYQTTEEYHCKGYHLDRANRMLTIDSPIQEDIMVDEVQHVNEETNELVPAVTHVELTFLPMAISTIVDGDDIAVEYCKPDCVWHDTSDLEFRGNLELQLASLGAPE